VGERRGDKEDDEGRARAKVPSGKERLGRAGLGWRRGWTTKELEP
jgi:hypothetical protein